MRLIQHLDYASSKAIHEAVEAAIDEVIDRLIAIHPDYDRAAIDLEVGGAAQRMGYRLGDRARGVATKPMHAVAADESTGALDALDPKGLRFGTNGGNGGEQPKQRSPRRRK